VKALLLQFLRSLRQSFQDLLPIILVIAFFQLVVLKQAVPQFGQILSGGLILGALFMATDPVTSPFTRIGRYTFGIMCGLLTVLIRGFSGYVEGVMFSIVLMNCLTPTIDHIVMALKFPAPKTAAAGGSGQELAAPSSGGEGR
jgi:Na+-translocating ferredoxin:NAD+ oxidoreductase RnfD subunit